MCLKERNQVEELVAKIADEDANEAKARAEKQMEQLGDVHVVHAWQAARADMDLCCKAYQITLALKVTNHVAAVYGGAAPWRVWAAQVTTLVWPEPQGKQTRRKWRRKRRPRMSALSNLLVTNVNGRPGNSSHANNACSPRVSHIVAPCRNDWSKSDRKRRRITASFIFNLQWF